MEAIILAGGYGTRLQSVVSDVPKPMAPINGRPFLSYLLDDLNTQGFTNVVFAVGYKKEYIMDYFKNEYKNIEISYSVEEEPLGTGGCIVQALTKVKSDEVFILNGDTMFKIDYNQMLKYSPITIACKKMFKFERYGKVIIDSGIIESFLEKKYEEDGYINGGIYLLPKNIFENYSITKKFSLEKDFFEKYIKELRIKAYLSDDYFIDIGIPLDYEQIKKDLNNE